MDPAIRVETITGPQGSRYGVVYLSGLTSPALVQAARDWATSLHPRPDKTPWWQAVLAAIRLPPASEYTSPDAIADALRRGYVAVVADHLPGALVGPLTLEQLLSGSQDHTLLPEVRRLIIWPRMVAALVALTLSAGLAAAAAYHHALMPGQFLIVIAATRQNLPLPVEGDLLLLGFVAETARAGAQLMGGRHWTLLGMIALTLTATAALQAGVVGPVTAVTEVICQLCLLALPNPALARAIRIWRYFFLLVAYLLGLFSFALLLFVLFVYLAWERPFGVPLHFSAKGVSL